MSSMQMSEDEARREVEAIAKIANMAFGGLADVAESMKPSRWDGAMDMTDRTASRWDRMADAGDVTFER